MPDRSIHLEEWFFFCDHRTLIIFWIDEWMRNLPPDTRKAFKWECWKAVGSGSIEAAGMTILLLIAVRYYNFNDFWKSLVATAGSFGLLVGPVIVFWVQARRLNVSRAASHIAYAGAVLFGWMALNSVPVMFALLSVWALTCSSAMIPLSSSIHQRFFPAEVRGALFSWVMMIRIIAVSVASLVAGAVLGISIDYWRAVIVFFAVSFIFIGKCLSRYPEHHLERNDFHSPFSGLVWLARDRLFFWTIVSWMVMGFGNLMMLPLRVQYLSDESRGVWMSPEKVTFVVAVVPGIVRLLFVPVWGRVFDRISLFRLRIMLNLVFAAHIFLFFQMESFWGLVLAGMVFGVAHSGGDVAWNLWVTRLAPEGRAADYMAVHTFMTGIRGFLAPFAGFWLLGFLEYSQLAWLGGSLVLCASLFVLRPAILQLDFDKGRHDPKSG